MAPSFQYNKKYSTRRVIQKMPMYRFRNDSLNIFCLIYCLSAVSISINASVFIFWGFCFFRLQGISIFWHLLLFSSSITVCTANKGPVRIQYKCLVSIYVFPEMKLRFVITITELLCLNFRIHLSVSLFCQIGRPILGILGFAPIDHT
jgi:hypothetical protein